MKTIGLIGGMSWESTIPYYKIINETVKEQLGGFHSAKIFMYSVDFAELEECLTSGNWKKITDILGNAALSLEKAGADFIVICTNTMHKVAPEIQKKINIPILHIADATAMALKEAGIKKAGLLGTKYTMTQEFYKEKVKSHGIDVVLPNDGDIEKVNSVIFDELCLGTLNDASRKEYSRIIKTLESKGAEAVILGCTEIGLLISQKDSTLPVYDTTVVHARAAALMALEG